MLKFYHCKKKSNRFWGVKSITFNVCTYYINYTWVLTFKFENRVIKGRDIFGIMYLTMGTKKKMLHFKEHKVNNIWV